MVRSYPGWSTGQAWGGLVGGGAPAPPSTARPRSTRDKAPVPSVPIRHGFYGAPMAHPCAVRYPRIAWKRNHATGPRDRAGFPRFHIHLSGGKGTTELRARGGRQPALRRAALGGPDEHQPARPKRSRGPAPEPRSPLASPRRQLTRRWEGRVPPPNVLRFRPEATSDGHKRSSEQAREEGYPPLLLSSLSSQQGDARRNRCCRADPCASAAPFRRRSPPRCRGGRRR